MGEDNDKHPHELNNVVVIFVYTCNEFVYHEKSKVKVKKTIPTDSYQALDELAKLMGALNSSQLFSHAG